MSHNQQDETTSSGQDTNISSVASGEPLAPSNDSQSPSIKRRDMTVQTDRGLPSSPTSPSSPEVTSPSATAITATGMLSPNASQERSRFVFPVRSIFQGHGNPEPARGSKQMTSSSSTGNASDTLSRIRSRGSSVEGEDFGRSRSPSLATEGSGIYAQGDSIAQMLEGAQNNTIPLSSLPRRFPSFPINDAFQNDPNRFSGGLGSPGTGQSRSMGEGFYSAPLPILPEHRMTDYFDTLLEERRRSDGEEVAALKSDGAISPSPSGSRSMVVSAMSPPAAGPSRTPSQQRIVSSPHAHGQIDPAPKDAPAPGQTTNRADERPGDKSKRYNFSHRPREGDAINISGPSDGRRLRQPKPRRHQDRQTSYDDIPFMGLNISGDKNHAGFEDDDDDVMEEAGLHRTDVEHELVNDRDPEEPDVGIAGERGGHKVRQDEAPREDVQYEQDPPSRPGGSLQRNDDSGTTEATERPMDLAGITILGNAEDNTSSYGTATSSLRGSREALHSAMRSGKTNHTAQRVAVPDYQSNVQKFVDRQAMTDNLSDPNAPTPAFNQKPGGRDNERRPSSVESANRPASRDSAGEEDDGIPTDSDDAREVSRSNSNSALSGSEQLMTVRFEHVTTEDGHHVVTGREGKLAKCEDEPITTPGAVQLFGVLIVLELDYDTDDLAVRQVSENSTELLGLSPRYLFGLPCFTQVLPRHQAHILRDNVDYLPDPDTEETALTDEGPLVFLLSGYGEPGSGDDGDADSGSSISANNRREWSCWVAAHRPAQKTSPLVKAKIPDTDELETRNLIILEFELEKDSSNPLYPPNQARITSGISSPSSGGPATSSQGSSASADTVATVKTVTGTGSDGTTGTTGTQLLPSDVSTPRKNSEMSNVTSLNTLKATDQRGTDVLGLDGQEMDVDPADVLESTTSYAKPLRALERLRRLTRSAAIEEAESNSRAGPKGRGRGGAAKARRAGPGSGGVGTMDVFAVLAQINDQLSQAPDLETFLKIVVGVIKDLTQFHRVLVYSFDPHWNGQVVAELVDWTKTHDLYKGLMFPATDIPAQARELYKINKVRLLYDRTHTTARMVLRSKEDLDVPLDMTHCYLRAMSPIHLVYLRNMGVRSSMSISIMAFGSLWGLIACHGYGHAGMRVSFPVRQMLRLLSDSVSRNIERLSYAARLHTRKLISTIPTDSHPTGYIVSNADDLLNLFDADCGVLVIGDGAKILGPSTEHGQEILLIAEFLRYKRYEQMQYSSHIAADYPELCNPRPPETISGLLYVPLSAKGQDFIGFLRKGQLREVHWAGKPYKEGKEKGANLEPRQSFKVWSETIAGQARKWTDEQLETAGVLALVYGKFIEVWRQKETAMRTNQMTSLLLNNATHEVRTPLNHIINYLELALEAPLDVETRENLSRSHVASKSLLFTINDLLDLTKIESGNETGFNDPFDIRNCVADAAKIYATEARRRGLEFSVDDSQAPDFLVLGDQKKIRTVVSNLVGNAVKYTTKGSIAVSCRMRREAEPSTPSSDSGFVMVEIVITDTGCGIPSEKLEAMFVTFEQADSGQSNPATGLGLGLAVVARIVEQVGGQLRAESEVDEGSRFYFSLLMTKHEEPRDGSSPHQSSAVAKRKSSTNSGSGSISSMSAGRELDTFVEAFSQSHMGRSVPSDERIAAAEARMTKRGTFPVADSSWPVRAAKVEDDERREQPPHLKRHQSSWKEVPKVTSSRKHARIESSSTTSGASTMSSKNPSSSISKGGSDISKRSQLKLRILVVEDDDVNRKILERRLKLDGHEVTSDINGQDAVDRITKDQSFDCILMDIQMPVMDGRQSAAAIRKLEETLSEPSTSQRVDGRIPIIAVSATLKESERTKLGQHFDGWMLKPIDFKRMLRILSGISDVERRKEDAYVQGQWEKGGWLKAKG